MKSFFLHNWADRVLWMSQCCPNHTSHDEAPVVSLVGVARGKHLKIIFVVSSWQGNLQ